jgi:hypothetical protein
VVLTINLSQKRIAVGNRSHGTQSSTIIVRGLATGEVDLKATWKVLWQEFATGALLGGIYGLLLGAFAKFRFPSVEVGGIQFGVAIPHRRWDINLCQHDHRRHRWHHYPYMFQAHPRRPRHSDRSIRHHLN